MSLPIHKLNSCLITLICRHYPYIEQDPSKQDYWDEIMAFNECYATYRQAHEFIGVWDLDEYLAPAYNHSWTKDYVVNYLEDWRRRYPNSPSLQLPMTWPDKSRFGQIPSERLLEVATQKASGLDPEGLFEPNVRLSEQDLVDIGALHQSAAKVQYWHRDELLYYVKSLHNTQNLHGANVHHGWPGPGEVQKDINGGGPPDLGIYHARSKQFEPESWYSAPPLTPSVLLHWQTLVHRIRKLGSLD